MDVLKKICPYCKSEFKEDDDVVICSVCEMPHHKECWIENKACSTFGCTGTIKGTGNDSNNLLCAKCGLAYKEGDKFCSTCGNFLLKSEQQQQYTFASTQEQSFNYNEPQDMNQATGTYYDQTKAAVNTYEEILTFIGKNQEYYFNKFQKINLNNSKVSWNWASAFLGGYWYAYRKMFLFQFLYYIAYFFTIVLLGALLGVLLGGAFAVTRKTNPIIVAVTPLLILGGPFVLSGMFGNMVYKHHVEQHLKKARYMDAYMKQNYLIEKGGTSNTAVWMLIGISILLRVLRNLWR